jgi:hypothetical protein
MVSEYILGYPEKYDRREVIAVARLLPNDPENLGAQIFRGGGAVCPASEIAVDAVMGRRVSGEEPCFPLQIHAFPILCKLMPC